MTRPRIGDLAIAKFDGTDGKKYYEVVCLITGRNNHREFEFVYASKPGEVIKDTLPMGRLRAVAPIGALTRNKPDDIGWKHWNLIDMNLDRVVDV